MNKCSINDLKDKEVINICDGKRLGYINDVEIDICAGCVLAIVVLFDCRIFGFGKCEELVIPWDGIGCFGKDAVLVNVDVSVYEKLGCEKKSGKK
ncbi:MAG: YlmC/YmxH family sporulation protein [Clostridiales bacterium]|nr:MAG: YlmC/YmxH family sporulation protein [Clostridiales bacterium]